MIAKYFFLALFLGFIITPAFAYNSGFRPVYQPTLPPGGISDIHDIGNVTSIGCALGQVLAVNGSAVWACLTLSATGEINTASNVGVGFGLFKQKTVFDLEFLNIFCAGDLVCSSNSTDVRISYTDPVGGSGNATFLDDLGDVKLTSPSVNSILQLVNGYWIDKIFSIDNITCGAGQFVNLINNQTGATTCGTPSSSGFTKIVSSPATTAKILASNQSNTAVIKTLNQGQGMTLTNGSQSVTIATNFKIDNISTTCSGTDKVSSVVFSNSTGDTTVTCSAVSGGSGIPLPPKKWGQVTPVTSSTALEGLTSGCTILATATYIYDTTVASAGIRSTTAVTDATNGGMHCTGTDRHVFIGANNAYMYAKFQENKITTNRVFIGFHSTTTLLPNNADTMLDNLIGVGLCIRTSDTVYQFCHNDGDATTNYDSLTTTEDTLNHVIEIYTTDAGVNWCAKLDGGTAVCVSTEIPTTTTRMYAMNMGETDGGATAIIYTVYNWYLQSDR